jgi:hypothetical protein
MYFLTLHRSGIQILDLGVIESILAYHYFFDIQETILKSIHLKIH